MKAIRTEQYRILYLGHVVPQSMESILSNMRIPALQTQRFGFALVASLRSAFGDTLDVFSVAPILDYPQSPLLISPSARWTLYPGVTAHMASFVNVVGLKHLTRFVATFWYVATWTRRHRRAQRVIFMHGGQSCKFWGALLGTFMHACVLVPYLTDDLGLSTAWEGRLHKFARRLDERLLRSALRRMAFIIAMTEALATKWGPTRPHLVIPAILPEGILLGDDSCKPDALFTIVYSGGLEEHFGVRLLLDAFALSALPHWRLIITGKGSISTEINRRAASDQRITFKGLVSFEELRAIYAGASVFVNPRASSDVRVRYCFPSKLVEQMSTGVPVVSTCMPCLTENFRNHLVLFSSETPEGLHKALARVDELGAENRSSIGKEAREFVLRECSIPMTGSLIKAAINECFREGRATPERLRGSSFRPKEKGNEEVVGLQPGD
jgi:glycosyltransferase involved in cell wall biosynthesis